VRNFSPGESGGVNRASFSMINPAPDSTAARPPRWLVWLHRRAAHRDFLPLSGAVTALDAFLPVIPATSMLVATVWLRPKQWRQAALCFALGGAAGALALAALLTLAGRPVLEPLLGDVADTTSWLRLEGWVRAHGVPVLFALALGPWPVRTAVAVCALAGIPLVQIGAAVLVARLVGFTVLAWLTARTPDWLARFRPFRRLAEWNEAARTAAVVRKVRT
jgi:membrane protein YqaA with SNARE-associated domain